MANSINFGNSLFARAEEDLDFWIEASNITILKKIAQIIEAINENPFEGIGKPEPLKYNLAGCWSRRIN